MGPQLAVLVHMRALAAAIVVMRVANVHADPDPGPWRLNDLFGIDRLVVGLDQQTRFEHLAHDFRAMSMSDASGLLVRTLVTARVRLATRASAGLELEDSRIFASDATPLNTTLSDPLEILQAYVAFAGRSVEARAGRITIDLGTRRLVARNRFRNTINGFTGADAQWTTPNRHVLRGFVALPVTRLPSAPESLRDNSIELDEENTDALLWSTYYGTPTMWRGTKLELFVVGFHERDGAIATKNRQLLTGGARWYRKPAVGRFIDFDIEVMPQVGRTRETAADDDTTNLDHRALSTHAELGMSPAIAWKPRIALLHDFASGDVDPEDTASERFDPLFGARRFDFGPTGIYGPFARSNLQSPGLRVAVTPRPSVEVSTTYRWCWLASERDAWTAAGVRDASGASGRFLGEHVELQTRWTVIKDTASVEVGAAYLRRGRFARTAPSSRTDDASYVYIQLGLTL